MVLTDQKVKLMDGVFSPSEASDILNIFIDKKINFHKLQRLCITEQDCNDDTPQLYSRIDELMKAKESIRETIMEARREGLELQIESDIQITLIKK
ncbi:MULTISPECIES: hypothetical protein [Aquimarina]|uniref:hypothetical protein n=1 Tax=Aquimarina TaxID=290174 RepID=UPI000408EF9B|nr:MULTISPECIES: hypothetical protein [Aquimarina]AXT57902.1 hypothetical protein D1815_19875 [Aquimarina sp. AD1]RKN29004.1 hypothetical protein D7035_07405 [Aquimarina sp. AD1]